MRIHTNTARLVALCILFTAAPLLAQDEDVQLWMIANISGEIDDDTTFLIDASQRWRGDGVGDDQQTLRFTLDQRVAEGVRIGGGAMVLDAQGVTELRPHQQVTLMRGRIEARTRFEQRFVDGADRVELRLRQRIRYTQPLGDGWSASVGGEWLGLLQSRNSGDGAATEQWRAQSGIAHRLNNNLELGANYWLVIFPRGALPDRTSHVAQAVVSWRF